MQSQKKHKRPRRERVNAIDFAKSYATNFVTPEKAIANVRHLESVARAKATDSGLSKTDQQHYARLAGFWQNVSGLIAKSAALAKAPKTAAKQTA